MTAEVAILNKNAVALAADSAVTLRQPDGPKVYHTNKLFMLPKYEPVGAMVYGHAEFMGVPWELAIKVYRNHLGRSTFPTVEKYAGDILDFLRRERTLFPSSAQDEVFLSMTRGFLLHIRRQTDERIKRHLSAVGRLSLAEAQEFLREVVHSERQLLARQRYVGTLRSRVADFRRRYAGAIERIIRDVFKRFPVRSVRPLLVETTVDAICKDAYWPSDTGLVIAGFGREQNFPSMCCYRLNAIISGRVRFSPIRPKNTDIDLKNTSGCRRVCTD